MSMAEHTHPDLERRMTRVEDSLVRLADVMTEQTGMLREVVSALGRIEDALRRPGANGGQP